MITVENEEKIINYLKTLKEKENYLKVMMNKTNQMRVNYRK